jgi:hypothetical protein
MSKAKAILQRIVDGDNRGDFFISNALLKEIEVALAEPEQEPVAWMQDSIELYVLEEKNILRGYVIPLYTAPPKQELLSDEEIILSYRGLVKRAIGRFQKTKPAHDIGVDDEFI